MNRVGANCNIIFTHVYTMYMGRVFAYTTRVICKHENTMNMDNVCENYNMFNTHLFKYHVHGQHVCKLLHV